VRLLAVDTTTPRGSVAVVGEDGVLAGARVLSAAGHSRWLLPAAQALLLGLGVQPADLDGYAVTVGPGSFTGLRVGLSTVEGLAIAAGRPCVGRSALEVLGASASGVGGPTLAVMDAFRGEVFWALFGPGGEALSSPRVGPLEEALDGLPPKTAFVGDAVDARRGAILASVPDAVFPEVDLYLAGALGRGALADVAEGRGVAPSALRPLYLRGADIRPTRP
jgi:tRNA threonylcarbamoyladenosine biosynthesis protein TsaB